MDRCRRDCDSCIVIDCGSVEGQGVYRQVLGDVELIGNDDDRAYRHILEDAEYYLARVAVEA